VGAVRSEILGLLAMLSVAMVGRVKAPAPEPAQCLVWGSTWCVPCKSMAADVAALAEEGWPVSYHETDAEPVAAKAWGVGEVPTTVIFRAGVEIDRKTGAMSREKLTSWMQSQGVLPVKKWAWNAGQYL
jgi:thioredoxin-like negative regulator of GroEL